MLLVAASRLLINWKDYIDQIVILPSDLTLHHPLDLLPFVLLPHIDLFTGHHWPREEATSKAKPGITKNYYDFSELLRFTQILLGF